MKTKTALIIGVGLLTILTLSVFVYGLIDANKKVNYEYSPEGILELQKANFIANSGYAWTAKDELNYAVKLAEIKKSGGGIE